MNGEDWDVCRNSLISRGITDFTDSDIIAEYRILKNASEKPIETILQEKSFNNTKEERLGLLNQYCEKIKGRLESFHKQNGSEATPPIIWDDRTKTFVWLNRIKRRGN